MISRRRFLVSMPAVVALAGCSQTTSVGESTSTVAPTTSQPSADAATTTVASTVPVRASVAIEPDHNLVGRLVIDADEAVTPTITVIGSEREFDVPLGGAATHHEVPVVGLRAEHDYVVVVANGSDVHELDLRTGALPEGIPSLDILGTATGTAGSCTLFNVLDITAQLDPGATSEQAEPPQAGMLLAVDSDGEIVWYHRTNHPIGDTRQLPDGSILHEYNDTGGRRINLFGETIEEWAGRIISGPLSHDAFGRQVAGDGALPLDTDSIHHALGQLPDGNYVGLSTELLTYTGFGPEGLCGEDGDFDGSYDLIVDVVVVFTPSGEIVETYPLSRYLDPVNDRRDQNLCGLPLDGVFPNWLYRAQGFANAQDWTHANAVISDPTGQYLTVSVRHLNAILQIERGTGVLAWRFGPGGDFTIADDADFSYYQHAPQWQDDGTLLIYDNGNGRPVASSGPDAELTQPYTRVTQYRLDPEAGEAELVWRWVSTIDDEPLFAAFVGDADRLANGNVLVTDGGLNAGRPDGITARIAEIAPTETGADTVFEVRLAEPGKNLAIYRSERLTSLYPLTL